MVKILEKVERRLGEKLFIKGDRCAGPKCALTRKNYAPGVHGKSRGKGKRREPSEFGVLFREKQKIRFAYGLDDKDLKRYITIAVSQKGTFSVNVFKLLECRLDNVLYRLGFADSRRMARQAVSHGHIMVNDKRVSSPSYQVKRGNVVSLKEQALKSGFFKRTDDTIRSYEAPRWLSVNKSKKIGTMTADPEVDDIQTTVDVTKVKEFYSR